MSINKRFLYGISALLILGHSLISPFNKASALEVGDKNHPFNITKKLYIGDGPNNQIDVTNYLDILLFSNRTEFDGRKIQWSCPILTKDQAFTSYKKAIANNEGWLLTQTEHKRTVHILSTKDDLYTMSSVNLYWSEVKTGKLPLRYTESQQKYLHNMYISGVDKSVIGYYLTVFMDYRFSNNIYVSCGKLSDKTIRFSANNPDTADYWIEKGEYHKESTYLNTFPYEIDRNTITWGIGFIPDAVQQTLYPHFEYDLKYLKLKLHHLKKEDSIKFPDAWSSYDNKKGYYIPDKSDYYLQFTVQKRKGGEVVPNGLQYVKADGSFEVDLPSLDEYSISAKYTIKVCYAYSYDRDKTITPAEGDYCFYSPPDEKEDLKYADRTVYIKADGKVHSGSTLGLKCDYGFCSELPQKPKYEDCSQYDYNFNGLKIPSFGSIACAIRNSFIWFVTDFLFSIIFPKIEDLQSLWNDLLNTIIDRLGFLALPFTFIKGVFTTVQAMTTTNNTCALNLTVFGSTANVELCRWRYQLPQVWAFMQTILQGGIAIGFLWTCYRLANRFFGIYVEDYEEEDHETQSVRWLDERTGDHGDWEERRKD